MKKRIISLVMAMFIIVLAVTLTACGSRNPESNTTEYTLSDISSFKNIEGKDTLFYDKDTRVVYYLFSTHESYDRGGFGYGYMAPYISENGYFCKYIDGKIVEIINN